MYRNMSSLHYDRIFTLEDGFTLMVIKICKLRNSATA